MTPKPHLARISPAPQSEASAGLELIAESLRYAADRLGLNGASTNLGALELVAKETLDGSERIATALDGVAEALENIASAIRETRADDCGDWPRRSVKHDL